MSCGKYLSNRCMLNRIQIVASSRGLDERNKMNFVHAVSKSDDQLITYPIIVWRSTAIMSPQGQENKTLDTIRVSASIRSDKTRGSQRRHEAQSVIK